VIEGPPPLQGVVLSSRLEYKIRIDSSNASITSLSQFFRSLRQASWLKWIYALLVLRFAMLGIRAFLPLGYPDIWRQVDTLSVSLRYWMRWTIEPAASSPWVSLLPAVLASGDGNGIMAMEFPLLNLLGAPFFAFGPYWGRSLAVLVVNALALTATLAHARVWKGERLAGIPAWPVMLLLPVYSFSLTWSSKFMPDYLSVLLVGMALGLSWRRPGASFLLGALGLLMKPTSIVVYALALGVQDRSARWRKACLPIAASIAIAALYYTLGMRGLRAFQDTPSLFAVEMRPLWQSLAEYWTQPELILNLLFYRPIFPAGLFFAIALGAWKSIRERQMEFSPLWAIVALQWLAISALDGPHSFIHAYYYLGLAPTFALLLGDLWLRHPQKWVRAIWVVGCLVPLIEFCFMDLKTLYKRPIDPYWQLDRQCETLKARHPEWPWRQGAVFRTADEPYPTLGLCFGERQGSARSRYGFFWKSSKLPAGCEATDSTENIQLAECR
jgi:hypothetical protein